MFCQPDSLLINFNEISKLYLSSPQGADSFPDEWEGLKTKRKYDICQWKRKSENMHKILHLKSTVCSLLRKSVFELEASNKNY